MLVKASVMELSGLFERYAIFILNEFPDFSLSQLEITRFLCIEIEAIFDVL